MKLAAPVRHGRTLARLGRPFRAGATSRSGVWLAFKGFIVHWLALQGVIVHFSIIPQGAFVGVIVCVRAYQRKQRRESAFFIFPDANRASGAPRCPPHAIAHQPSLTYCFFHSSALIGSSEMPYTASTFTWSANKPRWRPSDTRAACLSCI